MTAEQLAGKRADLRRAFATVATHTGISIPTYLHEGIVEYIMVGRPVGHFLQAVFSNDLLEACMRADPDVRVSMWAIVYYLFANAPAGCYGSPGHYAQWRDRRGLQGIGLAEFLVKEGGGDGS